MSYTTTRRTTTRVSEPVSTYASIRTRDYGSNKSKYKPVTKSRTSIGQTSIMPVQSSVVRSVSYGRGYGFSPAPGAMSSLANKQVGDVKNSRDQEKKDMQDLNERFAGYIEKVRFLEAQNKKLASELDELKKKWGKETANIKVMYQVELDQARELLNQSEKEKAKLLLDNKNLQDELDESKLRIEELEYENEQMNEQLAEYKRTIASDQSELYTLREQNQTLENQHEKDQAKIDDLQRKLNALRLQHDELTLKNLEAVNNVQALNEQLEFEREVHEQELKELSALAMRDTTMENREYWQSELRNCMRDIQTMYDEKLETMRDDMEGFYNVKIQEFRTGSTKHGMEAQHAKDEVKRLRTQMTDLTARLGELEGQNQLLKTQLDQAHRDLADNERDWEIERNKLEIKVADLEAEMEALMKQLQDIMDTKLSLELEIAAYRKLLEGEENRSGGGFRGVIESILTSRDDDDDSSMRMSQVVKGEMSAKTTYQRSAKGPIGIVECAADGGYIMIENTGKKEENLEGFCIMREIDGKPPFKYTIDQKVLLPHLGDKKRVKVYGKEAVRNPDDKCLVIASDVKTYGVGGNIKTVLCDRAGEEKATHTQKTVYAS